jgi:hypothetical protein
MPGLRCPAPEGTIRAFPDIRATGPTSSAAALRILKETAGAVTRAPSAARRARGTCTSRFGAAPEERPALAMDRLRAFFNGLRAPAAPRNPPPGWPDRAAPQDFPAANGNVCWQGPRALL